MKVLDIDSWPRRAHYHYFREFEKPFFSICADLDVSKLLRSSEQPDQPSFFVAALHLALQSANQVPELGLRIRNDQVIQHPVVHGGSTILRADETFGFAYFDYDEDLRTFANAAKPRIQAAAEVQRPLNPQPERDDLIFFSVIPWVSFTSFEHAMRFPGDSVPRVVFGRYRKTETTYSMPVSVSVHHALVDGLHVGRFFQRFEQNLASYVPMSR